MDGRGSVHQPSLLEIMRDLDQLRTWRNPEAAPPEKVRVWADRMLDIGEGFAKEALEKGWVVEVVLDEAAPYLDEMNPQERFNARSVKEKELGPAGRVFWQDEEQARLGADQEAKEIGQAVVQSRAPEKKKARI